MSLPTLTVIIPVLNRESTIEKAIQSVVNQNYPNIELIILDGGSTDNTLSIIKKYESQISYWHSVKDGGAAAATNVGLDHATGEIVGLLMADDWYEPGTFELVAKKLKEEPELDVVSFFGQVVKFDSQQNGYKPVVKYVNPRHLALNLYNIGYRITGICFRFIRRSIFYQYGKFLTISDNGEQLLANDKEFLFRLCINNKKNAVINHLGYTHLAHDGSFSFSLKDNKDVFMRHCREHIWIADQYLQNKTLSLTQKLFFKFWRIEQTVKLSLFYILKRDVRGHLKEVFINIKRNPFTWPLMFLALSQIFLFKRFYRILQYKKDN